MSDSRRRRHGVGVKTRLDNGESFNTRSHTAGGGGFPQRSRTSPNLQRMNSHDRVRKIVQEEGRTARNLVQYNVPLESQSERTGRSSVRQFRKIRGSRTGSSSSPGNSKSQTPPPYGKFDSKVGGDLTKSPKSDSICKQDYRARYWKFLFDTLQRAVDAIYDQCELDESVVECREVIMMLEQSTNDFRCLIDRLRLLERYEVATRDGDKPPSLAWEVRKMSPGKNQQREMQTRSSPSPAQRVLTFQSPSPSVHPSPSPQSTVGTRLVVGNSWADKVRGAVHQPLCPRPAELTSPEADSTGDDSLATDEDSEGWETVHRGGKPRSRNSPLQRHSELSSPSSRHNLRKSLSVPESKSQEKTSPALPANPNPHRYTSELSLSSFRVRCKDSEKENIPLSNPNVPLSLPLEMATSLKDFESLSLQKHHLISSSLSDEDDDTFTEHIDHAIAKAGDEEETLTEQLQEEQETAIKTAIEVEETWLKELAEEENTEIDVETETEESELGNTHSSMENPQGPQDWDAICAEYAERERLGQKKSWNEMVEEAEAEKQDKKPDEKPGEYRTPGHGVHMHEKLSSPSRRRSPTESRRRHEEKQAKAQELRDKLMQEKAERLRYLSKKVEEARQMKEELSLPEEEDHEEETGAC